MREILWIFAVWQVCSAGRLQIILPDEHTIDNDHTSFDSQSLLEFNKKALGMKTGPNATPTVSGSKLFEKPKALMVISIDGLHDFRYDGREFNFTDDFFQPQIHNHLKNHFGTDMMEVSLNSSGIFGIPGSKHFKRNTVEINETESIEQGIESMHKLAKIIKEKDRKNANVVDYYRIHLDVSNAKIDKEKQQLVENLKKGIDTLQDAIKNSYGGNVISEIYTHEQVSMIATFKKLQKIRSALQVTSPRYQDYPATFAICMFVCFALFFGSISMVWFMIDEGDMGKNSRFYRLNMGRPKKE